MIDPIVGGLVFAAVLTGISKNGRKTTAKAAKHTGRTAGRAAKNAVTSGYKATGWRTPGKALEHHSGRAGAFCGRIFAAAARKVETAAAERWDARQQSTDHRPAIRWLRDKPPARTGDAAPDGPPPTFGSAGRPRPATGTSASAGAGDPGSATVVIPDVDQQAIKKRFAADLAGDGVTEDEIVIKPNGDIVLDRRKRTPWATPLVIGKWTPRATSRPGPATTGPAATNPASTTTTAPGAGADRSSRMARYGISLEPPTNDAEFLATLIDIGDMLKAVAEEIENWAEHITGMGLPSSVTTPLHAIPEGITDAAAGATRAASAFEDEFEDAREVASRGMKFTGRDAA